MSDSKVNPVHQDDTTRLGKNKGLDMQKLFKDDPFCPTAFPCICDGNGKILSCVQLAKPIPRNFQSFYQKTMYHFTNYAKEILESGIFRFYWQMRNNGNKSDEVLSKYWFVEANKTPNGLQWKTHGDQWAAFSLAQITRTACFFTGKQGSRDADIMRNQFGQNVIVVNYPMFKKDVERYCLRNKKILFINKVNYVKYVPRDFYPLPILGKTVGDVGLEVSSVIKGLMQDGTCFNKTQEHKFEHEIRFIFFDEYATLDPDTEFIEVPISKETMRFLCLE